MNSPNGFPPDFEARDVEIIRAVEPYTMTSTERIHALIQAVRHIVRSRIPGDMVECGVWKGGSVMAMALSLLQLGDRDRSLYLFDTFSGMTPPTARDVDFEGQQAHTILDEVRCEASQQDVENAVFSTGYDRERIHFVPGRVEETIPAHAPELIALLRLDTDWYESTQHELLHLFPRLARGGVIIIDDYGHWRGARQAVDEYITQNEVPLLLNRIDYTGRIGVKI
ncbi:MAG TPA: TylF/MycF/NovP-related O-methyltransferase [Pyrinomonadaceae bacterium]|nr:TylF/MycF/NovP-related O-methyltransferase [Pyrinomonadaceae bacterium]